MCGIFGIILRPGHPSQNPDPGSLLKKLALLSESRGKDSSGIAFRNAGNLSVQVIKGDVPVSQLLKSSDYAAVMRNSLQACSDGHGFAAFGHARLVTNGSQLEEVNNQPVIKDGMVVIHNGIIVNVDTLWEKHPELSREYRIDTEIIPAMVRQYLRKGDDLTGAFNNALKEVEGTYSLAAMFNDLDQFVLATNNGSLYYLVNEGHYLLFASERHFLEQLLKENPMKNLAPGSQVMQLQSNQGLCIDLTSLKKNPFSLVSGEISPITPVHTSVYKVDKHLLNNASSRHEVVIDPGVYINRSKEKHLFNLLENNTEAIRQLKRCTRCLLPETFPFIRYDAQGVCNFCHNHKSRHLTGSLDKLKELTAPYRSKNGEPDCIVPFSGGRDSTYSLHLVKRELGLNPIAFTYDWGMVTDLARRNIARVCGRLGVENIIVSADIRWKRKNIRDNINAWLKHPALGMIPLFMAGDKFFFYHTNQLKKKTGIRLNIWGINDLENTEFKTGFAGLAPNFEKKRIYALSLHNQMKLFGYVASNIWHSPGYLNQSVWDSLGSFASRYIAPKKDYYHLFDYYRWDEQEIIRLLHDEYKWETAIDTRSTWRIGDGTASFYNYIYYTVAGFSENDTFRSNQIREGMLTREEAIRLIEEDNLPRYETLRWYFEIVGLDFERVIKVVNSIPKLYPVG